MKKFVLNADDLGKSQFHNSAVIDACEFEILKSASIMANMPSYKDAIDRVVLKYNKLGVGVHLNLIEGKPLSNNVDLLCDKNGYFNNSYVSLLLKSCNDEFLFQIEEEFRFQIEKCMKDFKPTHIDSHVHTHSIPNIFKIVCKLAKQYNINQVRTQAEIPYFIKGDYSKKDYLINLIKMLLLNYFTLKNRETLKKYKLSTNDYLIGVCYTGMMNSETILEGLRKINSFNCVVEALIHPCKYQDTRIDSHSIEFDATQDEMLKDLIGTLGFKISNYIQ